MAQGKRSPDCDIGLGFGDLAQELQRRVSFPRCAWTLGRASGATFTSTLTAINNVARLIAPLHITFWLPCGAQKRKNPPCEVISRFQLATSRARGRIFAKAWSFWVKRRWEIAADSPKPVGVGATFQRLIPAGERSGLLTHIAATESVSIAVRTKGLPLFLTIALFRSSLGTKVC
jgi:hypothetical protein